MRVLNNRLIIHRMLFAIDKVRGISLTTDILSEWKPNTELGFLVHFSVLPIFREYLQDFGINIAPNTWDFQLKIDKHVFDMKLILLRRSPDEIVQMMIEMVHLAQFTLFWEPRITLFREVDKYHELEEFIANNNLTQKIVCIEEQLGINSNGQAVKIVTFDKTVSRPELLAKYWEFLLAKPLQPEKTIYHYYLTYAFPWLQPTNLVSIISSPNERIYFGLQTFLTCLRELSYNCESYLDLYGLFAIKLALCDGRSRSPATIDLNFEIVALIRRILHQMACSGVYIKDGEFNLNQYLIDRNSVYLKVNDPPVAYDYFAYTFQNHFHQIRVPNTIYDYKACLNFKPELDLYNTLVVRELVLETIKLSDEESGVLNKLEKSNIRYIVDGKNYTRMNSKLFRDLLSYPTVEFILLDTTYKFTNEPRIYWYDANYANVNISLMGQNELNFIEEFIAFIKTSRNTKNLTLNMEATLNSYLIFHQCQIEQLAFNELNLTLTILSELLECDLTGTLIKFVNCTIEDNVDVWSKVDQFDMLDAIIIEDGKTWQNIFEYSAIQLTTFELDEYKFKSNLHLVSADGTTIFKQMDKIKFTFDEDETRLVIRDVITGEILDLYYLKNSFIEETKSHYEFYE